MNQPQNGKREEHKAHDPEIERVRELLARTVRFLARCTEDPKSALESEDPRDLIRGLESLAAGPEPAAKAEVEEAPPSIDIHRRRRSA